MSMRPQKYIKHRIAKCALALGCTTQAVYDLIRKRGEKYVAQRLRVLAKVKPSGAAGLEELARLFERPVL